MIAVLCLSACGDDSSSSGSGADAASAESTSGDAAVTAKRFNKLPIEDEMRLIARLARSNPDACSRTNPTSESFRQAVFINAAQAKAGTLIADLVAQRCEAG
jgi:hypothetical protein